MADCFGKLLSVGVLVCLGEPLEERPYFTREDIGANELRVGVQAVDRERDFGRVHLMLYADCAANESRYFSRLAHYDGEALLPVRIDVRKISPVVEDANLQRWRGALAKNARGADW